MYICRLDLKNVLKKFTSLAVVMIVIASSFLGYSIKKHFAEKTEIVNAVPKSDFVVIIDAGHGGEDSGAIGVSGVLEKDLNLQIALQLAEMLRNCGLKVILTREDDRLLYKAEENIKGIRKISDLRNRAEIARQNDNSIFVSIHMNSYSEPQYSGLQVYYSLVNPLSERLAQIVQTKVCERLQPFNNRKIKEGRSLYLMKNISSPAILIECGFLSNAEECEKISQKEYQKQLCFSFVCAIIEYMKAYHSEG